MQRIQKLQLSQKIDLMIRCLNKINNSLYINYLGKRILLVHPANAILKELVKREKNT